jgi:hypothetical protein
MTRSEQLVSAVLQAQFPHLNSLIHLFVGGSELHGAKLKDTDDLDIYGVYLEPPELVLGLDKQDFYLWSTAGNERRNTADDIDVCLYSLRKWAGLAAKGEDRVFKRRSSPRCRSLRDFAILEAAVSGNPEGMGAPEPNHLKPYWQESICADHIKPAAAKAGVGTNIGWHTFRHTYRTWLDSTGAPIAMQRELMQHASIETTMNVYGRAMMSDAKRQANSKVVRMALRPVLSTKAESGTSETPPLIAPFSSLAGGPRSTADVGCGGLQPSEFVSAAFQF